ncbi:unnamed protein product [Parnassius apollo]|uniref:(apollo) hypothetical protein n=1 Tax=Parnassius apollo TaxID=110799 RepID=A0A8S3XFI9_PARAO|nr:unnamed protein product [Parnassius apollo]
MKLLILVLTVCTIAAAAPKITKEETFDPVSEISQNDRSILVNILIRQLIAYVRSIINNGSEVFGIPPLDPLELNHFHLVLPTGLLNVDLELRNVLVTGIGAFVVHRSNLQLSDLTFDLDISVPKLDVSAELYDLTGNLFNAIPLYGNGKAIFQVEEFRFNAKLFLRQSDDGKSVIIDRIEEASFDLPNFKSDLSGAIGGGDIDPIVNAVIEEVIVGYINRFERVISKTASEAIVKLANPLLNQLDTWRYIAMLL